jgi:hypothetical protein
MKRLINKNVNTRIRATRSRSVMARCITSIALALAMLSAGAATIDSGTAQARATQFLQSRSHGKLTAGTAKPLELVYTSLSKADQDQANYYVFNTSGNDAFVIVAGDDRAPAVLAYSDNGTFDPADVPEAMQQAVNDSQRFQDGIPALFHRRNRQPWLVTVRLEDFMQMYQGKD